MSDTTKRLDLQFGSFACSVQGFDDPVQPVQQVLQALQNILEETPEIGASGIAFDAEAISQLTGEIARRADLDEKSVEIVPGLIIVQRSDADAADPEADSEARDGAGAGGSEAWSRPFVAGSDDADANDSGGDDASADPYFTEPAAAEADEREDAEAGFVNIFAPAARAATEAGSGLFTVAADDAAAQPNDPFSARFGQMTTADNSADTGAGGDVEDGPVRDIFADPGDGEGAGAGGSVFADPMAANISAEPVGEDSPVNFFSSVESVDEGTDGADGESAGEGAGTAENVFASIELADPGNQTGAEPLFDDEEAVRGEALFGDSENQPEVEEADDGYTAAGLAETAGAETVADLMVSAAAWMVLIQGQTTFTRREVIDVFEGMPGEHSKSLEARIKGFGKAVRNDQLIMIEDGVFGLSRTEMERFQRLL